MHLKKLGLRCTGTIRENVVEKHVINKKASRGTSAAKHEQNSGMNYVTVIDSKTVSIASTAARVTPLAPLRRYSSDAHTKIEIPFPKVFYLYNKFMGGVDLHDGHCNNLLPSIRSKKLTWVVFIRVIQASIVNSVVIFNAAGCDKTKVGTKEFVLFIAKNYIRKGQIKQNSHEISHGKKQKSCSNAQLEQKFCEKCDLYLCEPCFKKYH